MLAALTEKAPSSVESKLQVCLHLTFTEESDVCALISLCLLVQVEIMILPATQHFP